MTPEQKAQAKEVMDKLLEYLWNKVQAKVKEKGLTYLEATNEVLIEALEEGKHNA